MKYIFIPVWFSIVIFLALYPTYFISEMDILYPPWIISMSFSFILLMNSMYICFRDYKDKLNSVLFYIYVILFSLSAGLFKLQYVLRLDVTFSMYPNNIPIYIMIQILNQSLLSLTYFNKDKRLKSRICGCFILLYCVSSMTIGFLTEMTLQNLTPGQKYYYNPVFGHWTFGLQIAQAISFVFFSTAFIMIYMFERNMYECFPPLGLSIFILFNTINIYLQAIRINCQIYPISPTIPTTFPPTFPPTL